MIKENQKQTATFFWHSIEIEISYNPDYSRATKEISGYRLAHLQVMSKNRNPLPITETGYRSHFVAAQYIEAFESPIDFVKSWLMDCERSKKWQAHLKKMSKQKQLSLF